MEWLKNVFSKKKQRPKIKIEWGFYCAVAYVNKYEYRVISAPGIGQYDLLITLRNIAEIPELLVYANHGIIPMAGKLYSDLFGVTHRFTVSRIFTSGAVSIIGIWDICLDKSPEVILKSLADRILLVSHYTNKTEDMTWQGQINRMNWIGLLEQQVKIKYWDDFDIKTRKIYPQN